MAIYHASLRVLSRSKGQSAVAAAAYRAGVALLDERQGQTQDYSRRRGVSHVELRAPADAPGWAKDVGAVWNAAEAAERRADACIARELIMALPHDLPESSRQALALSVASVLIERYGVVVQVAVHAPDRSGDDRNHHAHLLFSTRVLGAQGFGAKVRVLDDRATGPGEVLWLRERVADLTNAALAQAGLLERVDHRTLAAQASDAEAMGDFERAAELTREPTRHQGQATSAAVRRGQRQPVAEANATIREVHGEALAAYLAETRSYRHRLLAAAHAKRAARQAIVRPAVASTPGIPPASRGKVRRGGTSFEESLLDVVRSGGRMAAAVIDAAGQRERLADRLAAVHSPETLALRRHAEEAEKALGAAQAEVSRRRTRLREAAGQREATQKAWDAGLGPRPSAWRPAKRQAWDQERKRLWGRLRKAIAAERDAQENLGPVARAALRSKVAEARKRLTEAQEALRPRRDRPVEPVPDLLPPVTAPTRRPGLRLG